MGIVLSDLTYLLTLLLHLTALLLALEWIGHQIPGARLNYARKVLFKATYPFLKWGALLGLRRAGFDLTPAVMIVFVLMVSRLGLPWIALIGFSSRN
jgi:hypothetical protein